MTTIQNEIIWITGATSGIGMSLVNCLAEKNTVIASGRNEAVLESLRDASPNIKIVPFDVTDNGQVGIVKSQLQGHGTHIDRVILNAGNCQYLDPQQPDWSIMESMMAVNFLGWVNCIEASFELLKASRHPHLVGIASQAILAPFSRAEGYGASKAAASYFLNSLRLDVRQYNIDVSVIHPGFVDTPLTRKNNFPMPFLMDLESATQRVIAAIEKRKFESVFPRRLAALLWFARKMPHFWANKMAYKPRKK